MTLARHQAHLLGWCALAALNALLIASALHSAAAPAGVRLLHHLFDAGQLVAAGLIVGAAVKLWDFRGARSGGWWIAAVLAGAAGAWLAADDLDGVAAGVLGEELAAKLAPVWGALLGLTVVAAHAVAQRAARARLRWALVALGAAIGVANALVLERLYLGVHLAAAFWAAALLGAPLAGLTVPRLRPRVETAAYALLSVWAAGALVLAPPTAVTLRLLALPSSALAPYLLEARALLAADDATGDWTSAQIGSDVPASPPLLPRERLLLLLLVVDCLRADLVNDSAHAGALPNLHALRAQSLQLTHAWAPGPSTGPSVAGLFAGRHYSQLYWSKREGAGKVFPHEDGHARFPEKLKAAGVATVEIAGLRVFTNEWGLVRGSSEELVSGEREAPAAWIVDRAIERLGKVEGPLFLHAHFMEAHAPYNRAGDEGTDYERYLRELAIVDRELGRLVAWIDASPIAKHTVVMLTADHGEAFGEHNTRFHATTMYEELLHVPLLIRVPGVSARVVSRPVTLLDVAPTVLDLFGQPSPGSFLGSSLVPYLWGLDPKLQRPVAAESGRFMRAMLFHDGVKLIHDRKRNVIELYDLTADPKELSNIYDESSAAHRERLAQLHGFFNAHELRKPGYRVPYRR